MYIVIVTLMYFILGSSDRELHITLSQNMRIKKNQKIKNIANVNLDLGTFNL